MTPETLLHFLPQHRPFERSEMAFLVDGVAEAHRAEVTSLIRNRQKGWGKNIESLITARIFTFLH